MHVRLIVELPLAGPAESAGEIILRQELTKALRRTFRELGYGRLEGVEYGVGKTSIILRLSTHDSETLPLEAALSELRQRDYLEAAVVAYTTGRRTYLVVWPRGFQGDFSLG